MHSVARLLLAVLVLGVLPAALTAKEKRAPTDQLPGKGKVKWDVRGLTDRFTVLRVRYDPREDRVTWLLEAKDDLILKPGDLGTSLFDEDRVRLSHEDLDIEGGLAEPAPAPQGAPAGPDPIEWVHVLKGERIRVSFTLPEEKELWNRVRYVVVASKAVPIDGK